MVCDLTISMIRDLTRSVDGFYGMTIHSADGFTPKGDVQDCDVAGIDEEWVDQYGPGMAGDDFHGTVTWRLGGYYIVAAYAT